MQMNTNPDRYVERGPSGETDMKTQWSNIQFVKKQPIQTCLGKTLKESKSLRLNVSLPSLHTQSLSVTSEFGK